MRKIWDRQNQETDLRDGGGDVEGADLGALAGGERHLGRLHADRLDAVVPVLRVEREWVEWLELQVQTEVKLAMLGLQTDRFRFIYSVLMVVMPYVLISVQYQETK